MLSDRFQVYFLQKQLFFCFGVFSAFYIIVGIQHGRFLKKFKNLLTEMQKHGMINMYKFIVNRYVHFVQDDEKGWNEDETFP